MFDGSSSSPARNAFSTLSCWPAALYAVPAMKRNDASFGCLAISPSIRAIAPAVFPVLESRTVKPSSASGRRGFFSSARLNAARAPARSFLAMSSTPFMACAAGASGVAASSALISASASPTFPCASRVRASARRTSGTSGAVRRASLARSAAAAVFPDARYRLESSTCATAILGLSRVASLNALMAPSASRFWRGHAPARDARSQIAGRPRSRRGHSQPLPRRRRPGAPMSTA